ncbi:fimbrial protein [Serratia nevei]|nr:fimbrial protein [Serratia nevei]MCP1107089.1 fimbrial protein [Serratia nevei]
MMRACRLPALLLASACSLSPWATAADNVRLHGALVAEPCVIPPGDESVALDFGTVIDKYLYQYQRTPGKTFELRLAECDLSLGNTLTVTLGGVENPKLPGLLALAAGSGAGGVAIGIETPQGRPLPLNRPGEKYPLQAGSTVLRLQAYVQGEPQALAEKKLVRGAFSAVATFQFEYQ